jgi:hypothetical protein
MSIADNAADRDVWLRKAEGAIEEINELRAELEIALRQYPPLEIAWRAVAADLHLAEARDQVLIAMGKIYQIR